jgi:hypothetical protein
VSKKKNSPDYIFRKDHYDKEIEKIKLPMYFNIDTHAKVLLNSGIFFFNCLGELNIKINEENEEKKYNVFLFTDSILIVKKDFGNDDKENDNGYEYIDYISLKYNEEFMPWVKELEYDKRCFQVCADFKSPVIFIFNLKQQFKCLEEGKQYYEWGNERKIWIDMINSVINKNYIKFNLIQKGKF